MELWTYVEIKRVEEGSWFFLLSYEYLWKQSFEVGRHSFFNKYVY